MQSIKVKRKRKRNIKCFSTHHIAAPHSTFENDKRSLDLCSIHSQASDKICFRHHFMTTVLSLCPSYSLAHFHISDLISLVFPQNTNIITIVADYCWSHSEFQPVKSFVISSIWKCANEILCPICTWLTIHLRHRFDKMWLIYWWY